MALHSARSLENVFVFDCRSRRGIWVYRVTHQSGTRECCWLAAWSCLSRDLWICNPGDLGEQRGAMVLVEGVKNI